MGDRRRTPTNRRGTGARGDGDGLTLLGASRTEYPTSPEEAVLERFQAPASSGGERPLVVELEATEMTALCPKTGQPDFGTVTIRYAPTRWCLESKSLKLLLFSYRSTGTFWEQLASDLADRLHEFLNPWWVEVTTRMNVRGGIAIASTARRGQPQEPR